MESTRITREPFEAIHFRLVASIELLLCSAFLLIGGCSSPPPPDIAFIEDALSIEYPSDAKVIGGDSKQDSKSYLISSNKALPLPETEEFKALGKKRPKGIHFPVSALSNLMAAYRVNPDDVPKFKHDRGRSIEGLFGGYQFNYREAMTDTGWLTAVEIYQLTDTDAQSDGD